VPQPELGGDGGARLLPGLGELGAGGWLVVRVDQRQ
jgi:hypothetical protein